MILAEQAAQVHRLPTGEFALLAGGVAAATLAAFVFVWYFLRRARIIEDTPTAKVRSAAQGYVELEGRGEPIEGQNVVGRLTGRPCLWYRYKVEQRVQTGKNSRWRTVYKDSSDANIGLRDDTGLCVVDPTGAEVDPNQRDVWYGSSATPSTGPRMGGGARFFASGSYRYTEERLTAGPLYALGWLQTLHINDGALGHEVTALLRQWKQSPARMQALDTDGDGKVDLDEWEQARREAQQLVVTERARRSREPPLSLLHRGPDRSRPFILSTRSQRELGRGYRRRALLSLAGSLAGLGVLLWVIAARLG